MINAIKNDGEPSIHYILANSNDTTDKSQTFDKCPPDVAFHFRVLVEQGSSSNVGILKRVCNLCM